MAPPESTLERSLRALGTDPRLADAVLGDLAEEFVARSARDGRLAARWWYVAEAVRSVPYVVRSILWYASPTRLAAVGAATALGAILVVSAVRHRVGPPAQLVPGLDDFVVNSMRPVRVPVHVLDEAGHRLPTEGVRYQWESGTAVAVSDGGAVTCTRPGDAAVRATLGALTTRVAVRCRPVRALAASRRIILVAGEPARPLSFRAVGVDGRAVTHLRGSARVVDSSVAALVATAAGTRLRPRRVGETTVALDVGEYTARTRVVVHEPVGAFTGLRPTQRFVAVPVRLARGETARWTLPEGDFWLTYVPRRAGDAPPTITIDGRAWCQAVAAYGTDRLPADEHGVHCITHAPGATVTVAHGRGGAPAIVGALALERVLAPAPEPY